MPFSESGSFANELEIGDIHVRDNWQFELKSEFAPLPELKHNTYTQEFYFFIPHTFQINRSTYSKDQFYRDQTNLIRYKTPEFTIKELIDPGNTKSPLQRILSMKKTSPSENHIELVEYELKLLGNIVRSSLRKQVGHLVKTVKHEKSDANKIILFAEDIQAFLSIYREIYAEFAERWADTSIHIHFSYVDEFISRSINYYLSHLLETMRSCENIDFLNADQTLSHLLIKEKQHREDRQQEPQKIDEGSLQNEYIFYRSSLLNKFVLNALLLVTNRFSFEKRFRNVIAGFSAGFAMLVYLVLLVWQGGIFAINSQPFILLTVILYILKDRLKEGLKTVSYEQAFRWFSDYTTDIRSPEEKFHLGTIKESFSFIKEEKVPKEIIRIRNKEFHKVLEKFKRPEHVIYYKKTVDLSYATKEEDLRRHDLNVIFRFNIQAFLTKLANPYHIYTTLDPDTAQFIQTRLPKVYHLNIIMKNTYIEKDLSKKVELKKFRLIIDKNGIKRIEQIG